VIEPRRPGRSDDTLHLSGHTDTVVPVEGWQSDPWKPFISGLGEERRITGWGTSDMKSGLAVMLHLARHLTTTAIGFSACASQYRSQFARKLRSPASATECMRFSRSSPAAGP